MPARAPDEEVATMFAKTGLTLVLPAAAVAVVVAGCGSSGTVSAGTSHSSTATGPTSASVPATVTDTIVPPTTTTTATTGATGTSAPPTATGPVACASANLAVTIGTSQGAAGNIVYVLRYTNKGSAACTIAGFPGVSLVAPGNGKEVGPAAVRAAGTTYHTLTLSSGGTASGEVKVADYANFPAPSCAATAVSGFRVYPPANTVAVYVPFTSAGPNYPKACAKASELEVQPLTAGTTQ